MKISIIITNFNGYSLLNKYLPFVYKNSPEADQIIVADDASTDDSLVFLKKFAKTHSKLSIISHKKNIGFSANSNQAVNKATGDLVVLLNSDIKPEPGYIKKSLHHFSNPLIFGVGFAEIGRENWSKIFWKGGYFQYSPGLILDKPHISGWLSGGSSIIRKSIFLKLGGFDTIYKPFYSEDVDLGFRAWKSGYKLIWDPACRVHHFHESTISKFPKRFLDYVKERNRLLVSMRLIDDPQMLFQNTIARTLRCFTGPNYIKIIRAAKIELGKHPGPIVFPKLTDKQVFSKFI